MNRYQAQIFAQSKWLVCTAMTRNGQRQGVSVVPIFPYFTYQKQSVFSCITVARYSTPIASNVVSASPHSAKNEVKLMRLVRVSNHAHCFEVFCISHFAENKIKLVELIRVSSHAHCFGIFCILACKYVCKSASINDLFIGVVSAVCGEGQLHRSDRENIGIGPINFYPYAILFLSDSPGTCRS